MNRFWIFFLCAFATILAIATIVYAQHINLPVLDPAGPIAAAEKNIIVITMLLCAIVVVPVFAMLFYFAWRYRAGTAAAEAEHHPNWDHDSALAEFVWWLVPAAIIAILGVIAVQSSNVLDPYKPIQSDTATISINVVALDWKWLFIYPAQGIASVNLVEFPVGTPVHFYLTADAPMNSFWIPQLAGQIMVMPGMTTQLNLAASRTGDFNGFSGNLSGEGFAGMAFTARAVSQSDFDQWVASVHASSTPLSQSAYNALSQPSEYNSVAYYAPVSDVFDAAQMKYMTPGSSMSMQMNTSIAAPGAMMQGMDMNSTEQ